MTGESETVLAHAARDIHQHFCASYRCQIDQAVRESHARELADRLTVEVFNAYGPFEEES